MIKAVIFDLDGVIIDTKKLHYLAWKKFWKVATTYKASGLKRADIVVKELSKIDIKDLMV